MPIVDLAFELVGKAVPLDHGYALFGALSRIVPALHGDRRIAVHPLRGMNLEPRRLTLVPQSKLRLRLPSEEIGGFLAIAGATLELDGDRIQVGVPRVEALVPTAALRSRLVTFKRSVEPVAFEETVRRHLEKLGIRAQAALVAETRTPRAGQPARRVLRVKDRRIVGFPIIVTGLTAQESILLQEQGLGGRGRMGCGIFVPLPSRGIETTAPRPDRGTKE